MCLPSVIEVIFGRGTHCIGCTQARETIVQGWGLRAEGFVVGDGDRRKKRKICNGRYK